MSNEAKKHKKRNVVLGIVLGIVLSAACRYLPPDYQTACNAVAEITAMSCGG